MKRNQIITLISAVVLVILLAGSMYVVKEGEYKVVLRFGEAMRTVEEPGLKLKLPFIENVSALPKYQMTYESSPTNILTKDQKPIVVDNYTVWRITNASQFLRTVQTVGGGIQRIDEAVYNSVRRKLSEINYENIISEDTGRGNINDEITKDVISALTRDDYGIEVIDVRIKRTDLPEGNKQSVYNRMISDRQSIAARYLSEGDEESKKITSRADRTSTELMAQAEADSKKIIAEGEGEAARIYNQAYGKSPEFYSFYRTLESYVTTLQNEPVIMIPIDSPYAKILLGQ
ncbi:MULTISPECIES: protease modulator HflC [unclassified Paenibacillus]|uniref:protease modulator HflC n=1 Tax=unclassified Paenibacillus TaxID=185978 RepID=UPI002406072E|nr:MULTISPECIES: protease modulator HflC [unclassified Paenibacillus]MDF9842577.1 membrane protease subunit HflC [Paenibacillus sp. PastF-2]MDF9849216.1 membrane protease subunit HflC [Paenibacillus sp. PastM-2]MDF9855737.1 membrane protease subunit HflC [Paenibacillus sp. PastF-1]MDH6481058.1 membrane protease subunit HflC [Paenibacillus sp. PastH-2]MDH6508430.1 membrane protease subunit HflC [Paenibacillus sp. PastM-3]